MAHDLVRGDLLQPRELLYRIIETPELVAEIQALSPGALARIVETIGLEDAGEIVSLATTEQLLAVLDEDLWQPAEPGTDERFDPDRFVLWLEVLLEAGETLVAHRLAALPEDLVLLALSEHILVLNLDDLAAQMGAIGPEAELADKALDSCLSHEFDQYLVISKKHDGWDAVLTALVALDEHHSHLFQRILSVCCHASSEIIEENGGLYAVLTSEEMLASDAAADREDRRAIKGYIAPTQAAAFLRLAAASDLSEIIESTAPDPITRAYFRELEPRFDGRLDRAATGPARSPDSRQPTRLLNAINRVRENEPNDGQRTTGAASLQRSAPADSRFARALSALGQTDPEVFATLMSELAYLANVLVAGCGFEGRTFRPFEAVEAAMALCDNGLAHLLEHGPGRRRDRTAASLLRDRGAVTAFRVGFALSSKGAAWATDPKARVTVTRDRIFRAPGSAGASDLDL